MLEQINQLLKDGEGINCEFKEARNALPKNLFETVCAFLNTDGGMILLGVNDSGKVIGVDPGAVNRLKSDIANLSNNPQILDTPFLLFPHEEEKAGKIIIALQVPCSSQIHRYKGKLFVRSEDGDYSVSGTHQIAGLINRKISIFTEQRVYPLLEQNDLRPDLFEKARRLMRSYDRNHPWAALSDKELFKVGGFIGKDAETGKTGFTLAGIMLFGSDEIIQRIVPGYKFDCLLRRNDTDRYDDRLTIRTNLIDAYDQMMGFVEKHMNDPFYLEGDMRISLRERVFREAISNIIAHREYTNASPATFIIFNDKVELKNPHVPHHFGKITLDNFTPFPKNPTICKFMIQLGRFDELGSGVRNINKYLPLYAKGAKPEFSEGHMMFTTTLPLAEIDSTPEVTPEVRKMLSIMSGEMTRGEIQEQLGLKDEKHFRENYQQVAVKLGLIEMTIPDKPKSSNQKYRLTEKGKNFLEQK